MTDAGREALADRIEKALVLSVMEQPEKNGPIWSMPLSDENQALIVSLLRAAPQPSDVVREALGQITDWCSTERAKIGAVDGYDYRSGEEYGLRRVEIEISKRALSTPAPSIGEPVAWTNEAQLGFLKDPACVAIPMAMWAKSSPMGDVPLYRAIQAAKAAGGEYQRCMDMLGDVPGATLEDRLMHYIGCYMAMQVSASADVRAATVEECVTLSTELTLKWGRATGTDYEQGAQDHGYRLIHAIRALSQSPAANGEG